MSTPEEKDPAPIYARRADAPVETTWKLEDIYPTPEAWEEDAKALAELNERIAGYRGHVMESAKSLCETITLDEKISFLLGKLYSYAVMRSHEDTAAEGPKALAARATQLYVKAAEATAYITPEILAAADGIVDRYVDEEPRLRPYRLMLKRILRRKPHTLTAEQETIMAAMGELAGAPDEIFSMLTDADLNFGTITDEKGATVPLTQESYGRYIASPDRRVRREAFDGLLGTFARYGNTLGAAYAASVKKDATFARLRNYPTTLNAELDPDEIPVEVYHGLVTAVNDALPALHDYVALKKNVLGVDHAEPYDLYAPLSTDPQKTYTYEEAQKIVLEALAPLGEDYLAIMRRAMTERWIDVYENKGKRSGAYSWGCYGVHPYMLLNYGGTWRDVSTLAHEGGHSIHTYLSNASQPQAYADYTLFVAEVASTVNETLLAEHVLANATSDAEKIFIISQQLELIRQTIYRQTLFAEFELQTHTMAEKGQPLTPETMNRMWTELNTRYYGPEVGANANLAVEWSRIPHFYRAYYVYQYATSLAAALTLADGILHGGPEKRDAYIGLLKGGCSKDPITLLRDAGVDMSTPDPVRRALSIFAEKTRTLKGLLKVQ